VPFVVSGRVRPHPAVFDRVSPGQPVTTAAAGVTPFWLTRLAVSAVASWFSWTGLLT